MSLSAEYDQVSTQSLITEMIRNEWRFSSSASLKLNPSQSGFAYYCAHANPMYCCEVIVEHRDGTRLIGVCCARDEDQAFDIAVSRVYRRFRLLLDMYEEDK